MCACLSGWPLWIDVERRAYMEHRECASTCLYVPLYTCIYMYIPLYIHKRPVYRMGLLDTRVVAEGTLVDLLLLAECDYLILQVPQLYVPHAASTSLMLPLRPSCCLYVPHAASTSLMLPLRPSCCLYVPHNRSSCYLILQVPPPLYASLSRHLYRGASLRLSVPTHRLPLYASL
jgi:hypothetical protein